MGGQSRGSRRSCGAKQPWPDVRDRSRGENDCDAWNVVEFFQTLSSGSNPFSRSRRPVQPGVLIFGDARSEADSDITRLVIAPLRSVTRSTRCISR